MCTHAVLKSMLVYMAFLTACGFGNTRHAHSIYPTHVVSVCTGGPLERRDVAVCAALQAASDV